MVSERIALVGADTVFLSLLLFTISHVISITGFPLYTYLSYGRLTTVVLIFKSVMPKPISGITFIVQSILLCIDTLCLCSAILYGMYVPLMFLTLSVLFQYLQVKHTLILRAHDSTAKARGRAIRQFSMSMGLASALLGLATDIPILFMTYFAFQIYSLYYEMSEEDVQTQRMIVNAASLIVGLACLIYTMPLGGILGIVLLMFSSLNTLLDVAIITSTIYSPLEN